MPVSKPSARRAFWLSMMVVMVLLVASAFYYTHNMTNWRGFDDEGGYLYAAWRISLGEMPYRDFLTPQLPLFLYPGALVLSLTDLSLTAIQWSMTLYVLGALLLTHLTIRRVWGAWPALLAMPLLILQSDMFWAGRFFRPEAPMLFWAALGLYLVSVGYPSRLCAPLAGAGVALGLAMMSKLFGALPMAGVGLFLLLRGLRTHRWRDMVSTGLIIGLPFLLVVGAFTVFFQGMTGHFVAAVLGHHLRQGSGTPWREVFFKALRLYWEYTQEQPVYMALAGIGVVWALWPRAERDDGDLPSGLFLCQLPTVAAFFLMTRSLQGRHLAYLIPTLGAFGGVGLYGVWRFFRCGFWHRVESAQSRISAVPSLKFSSWLMVRRVGGILAVVGLLVAALAPQAQYNAWVMQWEGCNVEEWVRYIQAHVAPDEYLMSDYPAINFFARRSAPPIVAGISRGATRSGQILGEHLIEEIETYKVPMVLINVAQGAHQFVNLHDYPVFKHYVQSHFYLAERRPFDFRLLEVYAREDLWPGEAVQVNLANQLELDGIHWLQREAAPGEQLQLDLRWRSLAPMPTDYWVTLRLLAWEEMALDTTEQLETPPERYYEWGLGGKQLVDIDKETWFDDEGLERAVLIPTSQWPAGEATIGTFELPVRPGTPPGTYAVYLRVHPQGQWGGLSILNQDNQAIGYDVPLGVATVLPADEPPTGDESALALDSAPAPLTAELTLLGHALSSSDARPGDHLVATLCWRAERRPTQDYTARLRLGGEDETLAMSTFALGSADYRSSRWRAGEMLCNQVGLVVDRLATDGETTLELELLDKSGQALAMLPLTRLPIHSRERVYTDPSPDHPIGAQFGDPVAMTLVGVHGPQFSPETDADSLSLTLHWQANMGMDTSYTLFVHLLDETGQIRGQVDTLPCAGACPTTSWLPNEIISETFEFPIDADALSEPTAVALGWYNAETGVRLSVTDGDGQPLPDGRVLLSW
jgi:hypothetical protein